MVKVSTYGRAIGALNYGELDERGIEVAKEIEDRNAPGGDFLGWKNYASNLPNEEVERIIETAEYIRDNFDALVVVGIGGSYLGARATIDAIKGLYSDDDFEIIYLGNTLSANYTSQVLRHLENKKFAVNVVSKSGTTTEPAIGFRQVKDLLKSKHDKEYVKHAIYVTTDAKSGALRQEADAEGYTSFVIPSDIGGRFSVITPVGLLPIACAGIDIREFVRGIRDGEKEYSSFDYRDNPAYYYGATRYLLYHQMRFTTEMFVSYEMQEKMIEEWLKQLFDESEGKNGLGMLCASGVFTTDLHSMGQFIQDGAPIMFETIFKAEEPISDYTVPYDEENLDNLNYLAGKKGSYINDQAYLATLHAHTSCHTPAIVLSYPKMDAYNIGNLYYFFFRACAYSAYLLGVNPFNQPGVDVYKKNMFKLLGKPGYEDK